MPWHQRGRKRPKPRRDPGRSGNSYGMGAQQMDAISGWLIPKYRVVPQFGQLVSARLADGSLDPQRYRIDQVGLVPPGSLNGAPLPIVGVQATGDGSKHTHVAGALTFTNHSYVPLSGNETKDYTLQVPTAPSLTLFYVVGGTLVNGSDYTTLSGTVVIPANTQTVVVPVTPLGGGGGGTVTVQLLANAAYQLGWGQVATVNIAGA